MKEQDNITKKELMENAGGIYQSYSKYIRNEPEDITKKAPEKPDTYKSYPDSELVIKMPEPVRKGGMPLFMSLNRRRSIRKFSDKALSYSMLSQLLWATNGVSLLTEEGGLRTAPSAGGAYPVETYVLVNNMEAVRRGLFHYDVKEHKLEMIKEGEFRPEIQSACMDTKYVADGSCIFFWTAVAERTVRMYGKRAHRYIYLDAGHIAQNFALTAAALGLGSVQVGAFYDDEINDFLGIDGVKEDIIYMSSVGFTDF